MVGRGRGRTPALDHWYESATEVAAVTLVFLQRLHAHAARCCGQVYNYCKEGATEVAAASAADASERARAAAAAAAQAIHGLGPGTPEFTLTAGGSE